MSVLEILAVAVSFLGIWLTAKRWVLCWPVSLVACALYARIFFDVRLYADMALQGVFGLFIVYGWIVWVRSKEAAGDLSVQSLPLAQAVAGLTAGAFGALAIGWFLSRHTDASVPWMDAALSSFSLVAQYWTARRHAESWLLWIIVDAFYVAMFAFKELWLTAGLYGAMCILAIIGLQRWRCVTT